MSFAGVERGQDALRGVQAGHEIANGGADLVRRSVARPREVHHPGLALHDHVVAGPVFLGPVSPKPEIEQ